MIKKREKLTSSVSGSSGGGGALFQGLLAILLRQVVQVQRVPFWCTPPITTPNLVTYLKAYIHIYIYRESKRETKERVI